MPCHNLRRNGSGTSAKGGFGVIADLATLLVDVSRLVYAPIFSRFELCERKEQFQTLYFVNTDASSSKVNATINQTSGMTVPPCEKKIIKISLMSCHDFSRG